MTTTTANPAMPPSALAEPTYKAQEVAQHLRVDVNAVYDLIRSGNLRSVRIGRLIRVPKSALDDYLAGGAA